MTPILGENALEFVSRSARQTHRRGARLGAHHPGGAILCVAGALGSGTTCLAQGVGRGWGVMQTLISPSYVLIREYGRPTDDLTLHHVDLYRIGGVDEAADLGLDEVLGASNTMVVVEWADRARALMPPDHLWITLEYVDPTRRSLRFEARGDRHLTLLKQFRHEAFGV